MNDERWDVIIVGARCSGGVLGTLLAKAGVKTLMLDADALPSDMPMSTHYVHPPGMAVMDEIGIGAALRAVTPPTKRPRFHVDGTDVYSTYPGAAAYCPRRSTIDPMIQDAARAAGAELRDQHRVIELLKDGERVSGVVVETPQGRSTLRAKLVVGADGRKSTIARLTGVEEYLTHPMTRGGHFFYVKEPALWRQDARYKDWDALISWSGDSMRYLFQCDGDLLLFATFPVGHEARTWGKEAKTKAIEHLKGMPLLAPLLEGNAPLNKSVGLLNAHFFYRRPVGPGFALVGDAGNFKDFVTGHGMTDAFLGAKRLSKAILADTDAAYQRYWRERDVDTLPLYFDALRLGEVGFNTPFIKLLFETASRSEEWSNRFAAISARELHPFGAFSNRELMTMVGKAVLRGRFDVVAPFLETGKRVGGWSKELRERRRLLELASAGAA
jgi:flavin-dependent dehydrogenase